MTLKSAILADLLNLMEINDANIYVVYRILVVYINKLGSLASFTVQCTSSVLSVKYQIFGTSLDNGGINGLLKTRSKLKSLVCTKQMHWIERNGHG